MGNTIRICVRCSLRPTFTDDGVCSECRAKGKKKQNDPGDNDR